MSTVAYRLKLFAPRSEDATEATVMSPRAGSSHTDPFQVTTLRGDDAAWKPYLAEPMGKKGSIDPLKKTVDTGQITARILDMKVDSNVRRWLTAFLGDVKGNKRYNGVKAVFYRTTDGGATWPVWFTGRVQSTKLKGKLWWDVVVRDMSEELAFPLFRNKPHSSITYVHPGPILPCGLVDPWSGVPAIPWLSARFVTDADPLFLAPTGMAVLGRIGEDNPRWAYRVTNGYPAGSDKKARVVVRRVSDGVTGEFTFFSRGGAAGDKGYVVDGKGHHNVTGMVIEKVDPSDPEYVDLFASGTDVQFWMYRTEPSKDAPWLFDEVNLALLWRDVLDGKFGPLKVDGTTLRKVPYDAAAFTAMINDPSTPKVKPLLTESAKDARDWLEKSLLVPYNYGYYYDENGQVVPIKMAMPSTTVGLTTITTDDLVSSDDVGWDVDRGTAVTQVRATYGVDENVTVEEWQSLTGVIGLPACRIRSRDDVVISEDFGQAHLGTNPLEVDARTYRVRVSSVSIVEPYVNADMVQSQILGRLLPMRAPFGNAAAFAYLSVKRGSPAASLKQGQWCLVDVDELPDPTTNERGGVRLMMVVGVGDTEYPYELTLLDAGPNTVAVAPVLSTPGKEATDPNHTSYVDVTLNASLEAARVEFAITETSVGVRPADDSELWFYVGVVTATGRLRHFTTPSGKRVWPRARSVPSAVDTGLKMPSAWSYGGGVGYVDMTAIAAPSQAAPTNVTARSAQINITPGDSLYPIQVLVALGTVEASAFTDDDAVIVLPPGATSHTLLGLDGPSVQHSVCVRHMDMYGGRSAGAREVFSTGVSSGTAPRPAGLAPALVYDEPELPLS